MSASSRCRLQLKDGEQLYASSLPGNCARIACDELARLAQVRRRGLAPDQVGIRRVGEAARDRGLDPALDPEVALGRALAGEECVVALVDVARHERRAERVRPRDDHGRDVADVGRQARGDERADELARGDEHLAAQVAALLLGRELVLEVDAGGAGLDHRPHQLEGVQRPAEAGFGVGDDRRQPVTAGAVALGVLDLVGAQERLVQPAHERRGAVRRVQALIRVGLARQVRVRGDLPAGEVDRLEPRLDHLHRLAAGHRAERCHVGLLVQELPQALGAQSGEGVLHADRSTETLDVVVRVRPLDSCPSVHAAVLS